MNISEKQKRIIASKFKFLDGKLYSEPYVCEQIDFLQSQIDEIDACLDAGAVSAIVPEREYQNISESTDSKHARMVLAKCELEQRLGKFQKDKEDIDAIYDSCNPEERMILELRYRKGLRFRDIASRLPYSREGARRIIKNVFARN